MVKYKGMQWKILFEILTLVIVFVIVVAVLIVDTQGQIIYPFENKTELRIVCEMWNCEEPIPPILISEISECSTISGCKSYCESIGVKCK